MARTLSGTECGKVCAKFVEKFRVKYLKKIRGHGILSLEVITMRTTRYSTTRLTGAEHTACTKLRKEEKERLQAIATEKGISNYELTRRIIQEFIAAY